MKALIWTAGAPRGWPAITPLVVLERPVGVVAADDVNLADLVASTMPMMSSTVYSNAPASPFLRAKPQNEQGEDADVRRRDVPVQDEVDAIALTPGLDVVGHAAQPEKIVGFEEKEAVVAGEALLVLDFFPDGDQAFVGEMQVLTSASSRSISNGPQADRSKV